MSRPSPRQSAKRRPRRLSIESLERRQVLATFIVNTAVDVVSESDLATSLREAIALANDTAGHDTIEFEPAVFAAPSQINLSLGQLEVSDALTINGPAANLTLMAGQDSRILSANQNVADLVIRDLTLQGGRTTGQAESGGALAFDSAGQLSLHRVTLFDNATQGNDSPGGALFSLGATTIVDSLVSGNRTEGGNSHGGGLYTRGSSLTIEQTEISSNETLGLNARGGGAYAYAGDATISQSLIIDNQTGAEDGNGGGLFARGGMTIVASRVSGNQTLGEDADGGGISSRGDLTLTQTAVHQNQTHGRYAAGGGISATSGSLTLTTSSVTSNQTLGSTSGGGGIVAVRATVALVDSTLSSNAANGTGGIGGGLLALLGDVDLVGSTVVENVALNEGGGIFLSDNAEKTFVISNSIVALNQDSGAAPDIRQGEVPGSLTVLATLVGDRAGSGLDESQTADADGNLVGDAGGLGVIDPLIGPLFFSGVTHVRPLLENSPAIGAGNGAFVTTSFDGRSEPFLRVSAGTVDMGAFEFQFVNPDRLVVNTLADELNFANNDVSLREAIHVAGGLPGANTITFDDTVTATPGTIELSLGELVIDSALQIIGPGSEQLVVDAMQQSRVIRVANDAGDVTLSGLTLTGGVTSRTNVPIAQTSSQGGGILSQSDGMLVIVDSKVSGNATFGDGAFGGGIYSAVGAVDLIRSEVSDNQTRGFFAPGGGLFAAIGDVTVVDSRLTGNLTGGVDSAGGAIASIAGNVSVDNSLLANNRTLRSAAAGGALYSVAGNVTITSSELLENFTSGDRSPGGAVFAGAGTNLEVMQSEISGNRTSGLLSGGGAVYGQAVNLFSSTIAENETDGDSSRGGGVFATQLSMTNTTVSGNQTRGASSDGGGVYSRDASVLSSTVVHNVSSANGGGITIEGVSAAQLDVANSIVAANSAGGTGTDVHFTSALADLSVNHSLIGDAEGSGLTASLVIDANGNLIGGDGPTTILIDPGVEPLTRNGGNVRTHGLAVDSPAVNLGSDTLVSTLTNDARGEPFSRSASGRPDAGALERQRLPLSRFVVTTAADEVDYSDAVVSLREAIAAANGSDGHDVVSFDPSVFDSTQSIDLELGELVVTNDLTIVGPGSGLLTLDAGGRSRVIRFQGNGQALNLSGLTISGGSVLDAGASELERSGGGIQFVSPGGTLSLTSVIVRDNVSTSDGGGVFAEGAVVLDEVLIDSNVASQVAGGVRATQLVMTDSVVTNNQANVGGGLSAASVSVVDSTVSNNIATGTSGVGGGVDGGTVRIFDSIVTGNRADQSGGGIAAGSVELRSSVVTGNVSGTHGGGVDADVATVLSSSVSLNRAGTDGGGLYLREQQPGSNFVVTLTNSTLSGNEAIRGGGLFSGGSRNPTRFEIQSSTVANNQASGGGGMLLALDASLTIRDTLFAGNTDSLGIPNFRPLRNPFELTIENSLIDDNTGTGVAESKTPDANGNLVGRPTPDGGGLIDAGLDPLTEIAGTLVHPLLPTSPAIDAGSSVAVGILFDQRGAPFTRLFGSAFDMGAFETQPPREPVLRWDDPAPIATGTPLGSQQLNARTTAAGTFVYDPAPGALLASGLGQTLTVQFQPDLPKYFSATSASASIDVVDALDFGDAPDSYATRLASDGPRHGQSVLHLGASVDDEVDGAPGVRASGDGTDDDGIRWITSLVADETSGTTATVIITASESGLLDAWIDFDGNGVFDHPTEHIGAGTSLELDEGENLVEISLPAGTVPGNTFARFRISSTGGLLPTGAAIDGEVEDHEVEILDGRHQPTVTIAPERGTTRLGFEFGEFFVFQGSNTLFQAPRAAVGRYDLVGTQFSDILVVDDSGGDPIPDQGFRYDAGSGVNTLRIVGPRSRFEATGVAGVGLHNIDVVDLSSSAATTLVLESVVARQMDPGGGGIIVTGGTEDTIQLSDRDAWSMAEPVSVAGFAFSNVVTRGTFVQVDFASPWQNLVRPGDVGNDGNVTANDALRIINELGRRIFSDPESAKLFRPDQVGTWPGFYFDQNGDGSATALDALRVINELARIDTASVEGEWVETPQWLSEDVDRVIARRRAEWPEVPSTIEVQPDVAKLIWAIEVSAPSSADPVQAESASSDSEDDGVELDSSFA